MPSLVLIKQYTSTFIIKFSLNIGIITTLQYQEAIQLMKNLFLHNIADVGLKPIKQKGKF